MASGSSPCIQLRETYNRVNMGLTSRETGVARNPLQHLPHVCDCWSTTAVKLNFYIRTLTSLRFFQHSAEIYNMRSGLCCSHFMLRQLGTAPAAVRQLPPSLCYQVIDRPALVGQTSALSRPRIPWHQTSPFQASQFGCQRGHNKTRDASFHDNNGPIIIASPPQAAITTYLSRPQTLMHIGAPWIKQATTLCRYPCPTESPRRRWWQIHSNGLITHPILPSRRRRHTPPMRMQHHRCPQGQKWVTIRAITL